LAGRDGRRPGRGNNPKTDALVKAKFTRDRVFTTTQDTPLRHRNLIRTLQACCKKAVIEILTLDTEGNELEHVDLHSLRRTFTTTLIVNGADPETVRQLLGHKTLDMTMKIYTKVNSQTKRQAIGKLVYGGGAKPYEHVLPIVAG
jgi:integrase